MAENGRHETCVPLQDATNKANHHIVHGQVLGGSREIADDVALISPRIVAYGNCGHELLNCEVLECPHLHTNTKTRHFNMSLHQTETFTVQGFAFKF